MKKVSQQNVIAPIAEQSPSVTKSVHASPVVGDRTMIFSPKLQENINYGTQRDVVQIYQNKSKK